MSKCRLMRIITHYGTPSPLFISYLILINMRKFNLTILFLLALLPVLFAGIYNPERGFRLEIAVDIAKKCDVWKPQEYPGITDYLESEINKYACDSVSLVQTYFYLHGYIGRQLPPEAFATMDVYFNKLRQLGKKALLRFAYETEPMGTVRSHNGRYVSPYETIETLPREKQRCHTGSSSRIYRCMGRMAQFQT